MSDTIKRRRQCWQSFEEKLLSVKRGCLRLLAPPLHPLTERGLVRFHNLLRWYNIRYSWGTLSLNMDQLLTRLPVWGSTGMLIISRSPNLNSQNSYHHHLSQRKKEKLTIRKNCDIYNVFGQICFSQKVGSLDLC